jgi:hypothetical protein
MKRFLRAWDQVAVPDAAWLGLKGLGMLAFAVAWISTSPLLLLFCLRHPGHIDRLLFQLDRH